MDLSDGLAGDALRLSEQSGVRVNLRRDALPVSGAAKAVAEAIGARAADFALVGGEDFELLFTAPENRVAEIASEMVRSTGTPVTVIGNIVNGEGVWADAADGGFQRIDGGFDHFK